MKRNPAISFKVELNFFFFFCRDPVWVLQGFCCLFLLRFCSIAVRRLFLSHEQKPRSHFIPLYVLGNTNLKNELISLLGTWHFYVYCFTFQWNCHHLFFLLCFRSQCCFVWEQAWLVPFIEEELLYSSSAFDDQFNLIYDWAVTEREGILLLP